MDLQDGQSGLSLGRAVTPCGLTGHLPLRGRFIQGLGCLAVHHSTNNSWSTPERAFHTSLLVLRAIHFSPLHFEEMLRGRTVTIISDNSTAFSFLLSKAGHTRPKNLSLIDNVQECMMKEAESFRTFSDDMQTEMS